MKSPCNTLTLADGYNGATVAVSAAPIARHGATVRLQVIDRAHLSRWASLDEACTVCGADVSTHVLEAYRLGREMAIDRARALTAFDVQYVTFGPRSE